MVTTANPTAAALRPRTLSAQGSPFAPSTCDAMWREQLPTLGVPSMHGTGLGSLHPIHNSIPATLRFTVPTPVGVTPAIRRNVYGAAKQAAPPRGVPR